MRHFPIRQPRRLTPSKRFSGVFMTVGAVAAIFFAAVPVATAASGARTAVPKEAFGILRSTVDGTVNPTRSLPKLFVAPTTMSQRMHVSSAHSSQPKPSGPFTAGTANVTSCSNWYIEGKYAGYWATSTAWWEFNCVTQGSYYYAQDTWADFYFWNGSGAVYYGTWWHYGWGGDFDPNTNWWWWDAPSQQWYGPYICIAGCVG